MRILIAPDKFKGTLSAKQAAEAMALGARRAVADVEIDICPLADGGEGTVDALVAATGGRLVTRRVTGPLPEMRVEATFGILGGGETAVIEMSAASGLALLRAEDRNPMATTSFGTGELMMAAVELGVSRILLGIGGSATVDGGIGCAQACGLPVILAGGEPLSNTEPLVGGDLDRVVLIKHGRGSAIERVSIEVACDVENPLVGPNGAARVFGPQKGATPRQVEKLDADLRELARRCGKLAEADLPGAGAAGGLGFAMAAFFRAKLRPGIDIVMQAVNFDQRLRGMDFCFTGEGRLDHTSLNGKTLSGVARACRAAGVPLVGIVGSIEAGLDLEASGIVPLALTSDRVTVAQAIAEAPRLIADRVAQFLSRR
jgi:glycerate kinase